MATYQWGSYSESDECYGLHRVHMVVYPPTSTRADRGWLRLWRSWSIVGLILGIGVFAASATVMGTLPAAIIGAAVPLGIAIALACRVHNVRTEVAEILSLIPPDSRYYVGGSAAILVAQRLIEASDLRRSGQLDSAAYRRDWQRAYDYARR